MNEVSMKVNQANLVKGLKYSFTNKTTVLGELMQNARRAGANQVVFNFDPVTRSLRISDDGCGIESLEALLTIAESGWDTHIVAEEHPFGIGFLSALFACKKITVSSKSGYLSVRTADVLSFKPVTVEQITCWNGVTEILLQEVDITEDGIKSALEKLASGFSIPVIFNNKVLDRGCSINSGLQFISTEIGGIYLSGLDTPYSGSHIAFKVFLQGLPIYSSHDYLYGYDYHVIHLDSSSFYARLPDREKLINEDDVIVRIKDVLVKEIEKSLISMRNTLPPEEFVKYFYIMRDYGLLRLLNDVPVAPVQALGEIIEPPHCETDYFGSFIEDIKEPLSRCEIEEIGVVQFDEYIHDDGSELHLFAMSRGNLIFRDCLDKDHWLNSMIQKINQDEVLVEMPNESRSSYFEGYYTYFEVWFCDSFKINVGNDTVEIRDQALFTGNDGSCTAIIPKGYYSTDILKQVSTYTDEYDVFQESAWETDVNDFEAFLAANTTNDPVVAIKRLLPNFKGCPLLYGESFILTLNKQGIVESVTASAA